MKRVLEFQALSHALTLSSSCTSTFSSFFLLSRLLFSGSEVPGQRVDGYQWFLSLLAIFWTHGLTVILSLISIPNPQKRHWLALLSKEHNQLTQETDSHCKNKQINKWSSWGERFNIFLEFKVKTDLHYAVPWHFLSNTEGQGHCFLIRLSWWHFCVTLSNIHALLFPLYPIKQLRGSPI